MTGVKPIAGKEAGVGACRRGWSWHQGAKGLDAAARGGSNGHPDQITGRSLGRVAGVG
jgi:hypothetical protein